MLIAALSCAAAMLATSTPPPVHEGRAGQTRVVPPRVETTVRVDGVLDEPAWSQAARLGAFTRYAPVDGPPADESTEVLVFYSPEAIHFGVRAQAAPGSIRATLANRDRLDSEDQVRFFLLPWNDGRQALYFAVNPLGVQADGALVEGLQASERGGFGGLSSGRETPDLAPDFVFESKGRVTDAGFEVELRIPFKSLRFPASPRQDWGLHVTRLVQARGHEDSWVPAVRAAASFLAQAGTLAELEGLQRGLVLDLTPVLTAKADGAPRAAPGGGWDYDAGAPELGGNVRWGVTSNLTLNGTLRPDFSQVEADAGQFVFDPRSAVFFPEKRPFFLDGSEQFATPNRLIYTRRIVAPEGAAKLSGKLSGTTVALLSAVDGREHSRSGRDHPLVNLLRVQRDLGGNSKAAFVYTDRIDGADSNRVAAADARLAFGQLWSVQLQAALSRTKERGVTRTAPLWEAIANRNGRRFGLRWLLTGIHPDFRAESGFITRGGVVHANLDQRLTFFGKQGGLVESFSTDAVFDGTWKYRAFTHGEGPLERKLHFNNNVTLRGGWRAGLSFLVERWDYDADLYADYALLLPDGSLRPYAGTPSLYNADWVASLSTPTFAKFSANAFYLWGRDENFFEWALADILFADFGLEWRPTEQLRLEARYQRQSFVRRRDGSTVAERDIPRLKVEYQVNRAVFLRVVGEYDAERRDALRDTTRTELPIVVRGPDGTYRPATAFDRNALRLEFLFSYQPTPGTVFFAGYQSRLREPRRFGFGSLARESDGFFVKLSYLFRM
jgi:hypothetical protein